MNNWIGGAVVGVFIIAFILVITFAAHWGDQNYCQIERDTNGKIVSIDGGGCDVYFDNVNR